MKTLFAKRLREIREKKRLTQKDLAKHFDVTPVAYGGWERGDAEPSLENLAEISKYFNVTVDWLLGLDDRIDELKREIVVELRKIGKNADVANAIITHLNEQLVGLETRLSKEA